MAWVKLDDGFFRHPKVLRAGRDARDLHLAAMCYAAANLTGGAVPAEALRALAAEAVVGTPGRLAGTLVEVGLWEAPSTPGGPYQIHDWDVYNPTRDQVLRQREENARRLAAWRKRKAANGRSNGVGNGVTNGVGNAPSNGGVALSPSYSPSSSAPSEHLLQQDTSVAIDTSAPAARIESEPPGKKSLEPRYSPDFEAWWSAYPRKREKVDAYAAYQKTVKAGAAPAELLTAATNYATAADEQGAEDQYIKLPATFLGPARPWLDFRAGVPRPVPRTSPAANGRHRPNAFEQIDLEVARMKGETP